MMTLRQSVLIDAPPDAVFAYVTDPAEMAEWIPPMVEVRNVVGAGEGQQFEWTYKLAGLLFRGQSVVVEHVPGELCEFQGIGAISSNWTTRVGSDDGGTKFEIEIEYDVPVPVPGRLAERVIVKRDNRNLDVALSNVKDVLETETAAA